MNDEGLFLKGIQISWDKVDPSDYSHAIPSLKDLDHLIFMKRVVFFTGENGSGKSTLLEAIAIAYGFNPEGGTRNYSFSTYDDYSGLHEGLRLMRGPNQSRWCYFLRAESFFNVATQEEEYSDLMHPSLHLHAQSHGESFLTIARKNFQADGFYLLDEPEAALSPERQLSLIAEIYDSAAMGAQFIIASNSPILLGYPDAEICTILRRGSPSLQ